MTDVIRVRTMVAAIACLLALNCGADITESRARELAEARFGEYLRAERISREAFAPIKVTADKESWFFDTVTLSRPRREVRITVTRRGGVEIHDLRE